MKKLVAILAVGLLVVVVIWAIATNGDEAEDAVPEVPIEQIEEDAVEEEADIQSGQVDLDISNFAFPAVTRVAVGTTVTWTNQDAEAHNVVSDDGSPQGGLSGPLLSQGESYSFTFNQAGIYSYHCNPHPFMTATVEVVE